VSQALHYHSLRLCYPGAKYWAHGGRP